MNNILQPVGALFGVVGLLWRHRGWRAAEHTDGTLAYIRINQKTSVRPATTAIS